MSKSVQLKVYFLIVTFLIVAMQPLTPTIKASIEDLQKAIYLKIKTDGSIEPQTSLLEKNGLTYTFKGDIYGTIWVQKGGITIDGAGHTLKGTSLPENRGILLAGPDLSHRDCRYVTVKNLKMINSKIYTVGGSSNTITNNYLENTDIHVQSSYNITGDLIKHNTYINTWIFVDYNRYGIDVITENNFYNSQVNYGLSDEPIVERNYWNNYKKLYPDAKEIDNSGVWNTPYSPKDPHEGSIYSATDSHPLINPIEDFSQYFSLPFPIPTISSEPILTPTPSPLTPTPSSTPEPSPTLEPEFPTTTVIASIAIVLVGFGVFAYLVKKRTNK